MDCGPSLPTLTDQSTGQVMKMELVEKQVAKAIKNGATDKKSCMDSL